MAFITNKIRIILIGGHLPLMLLFVLMLLPAFVAALNNHFTEQVASSEIPAALPQIKPGNTYGPIRTNEGLWDIAEKLRLNSEVSIPQMAVALFEKNPEAFNKQNMNGLLVGSSLIVPDLKQVLKLTQAEAFSLFLQHWEVWKKKDTGITDTSELKLQNPVEQTPEELIIEVLIPVTENKPQKAIPQTQIQAQPQPQPQPQPVDYPLNEIIISVKQTETKVITKTEDKPKIIKTNVRDNQANLQKQVVQQEQIIEANRLDYKSYFKQTLNSISESLNWLQYNLKSAVFNDNITPEKLLHSPLVIILLSPLLFIIMVWLYRREKNDFTEIKTSKPTSEIQIAADIIQSNKSTGLPEQVQSGGEIDVFSGNILPNRVDINKFISQYEKKKKRKGKSVLETAFENNIFSNEIGFIQAKEQPVPVENNNSSSDMHTNLLDSTDEIKFINEKVHNSKIDAFIEATQSEKITSEILSHDFDIIMNNEKIDVFIQEFENIMSNLTNHTPAVDKVPSELENLLQFKLSIHFIKMLSEMMQATYLTQFSTTIIEFLEDILDGKTKMTADITHRLIIVVNFYTRYIHSVKENYNNKIEV